MGSSEQPRADRNQTLESKGYRVICSPGEDIYVLIEMPDGNVASYVLEPEDAYEFASKILRAYDVAVGIAED